MGLRQIASHTNKKERITTNVSLMLAADQTSTIVMSLLKMGKLRLKRFSDLPELTPFTEVPAMCLIILGM